jgi:hypothetical protein
MFSDLEMSLLEDAPDVSWEIYEYISIGSKKKLTVVRKCTRKKHYQNIYMQVVLSHYTSILSKMIKYPNV